uniref:Uncharacterized protein n=1 Tax=Rhizophora mucronata TaxID=61149 RepID=A0A2P2QD42_RHIMU
MICVLVTFINFSLQQYNCLFFYGKWLQNFVLVLWVHISFLNRLKQIINFRFKVVVLAGCL